MFIKLNAIYHAKHLLSRNMFRVININMKTLELIRMLINRDKRAGLRHWQIAEKIGVSTGNITHWLNKSVKPDADSLLKISLAYGIPITDLMDEDAQGEVNFSGLPPRYAEIFKEVNNLPEDKREDWLTWAEFYLSRERSKGK